MSEFTNAPFILGDEIKRLGITVVAEKCAVSERTVYKWIDAGCLPNSAYSGAKPYADILAGMSGRDRSEWLLIKGRSAA